MALPPPQPEPATPTGGTAPVAEPHRVELDAPVDLTPPTPELGQQRRVDDPDFMARVEALVREVGGEPGSFPARLVQDLVATALKLIPDRRDTGELKLITAAVKELRYAFRVFGRYPTEHKVTIFGSARTPPDHPDYLACVEFSRLMAARAWMVITGAGGGIMEAGHVGPGRDKSFGVAIRLPFETTANEVILGDEKLIHFRYFFTRKLMFISQAEAVALFPGGFGTMDEAYEVLTLIQTGKASIIPIVMLEGPGESYWREWDAGIRRRLLARGLISPDDTFLYHLADTPLDAADHITRFYRLYHSSRYVKDDFVVRLQRPLSDAHVDQLNGEFARLVKRGRIVQRGPLDAESDHLDRPRLVFAHTRRDFGLVRALIDRINSFDET